MYLDLRPTQIVHAILFLWKTNFDLNSSQNVLETLRLDDWPEGSQESKFRMSWVTQWLFSKFLTSVC